MSKANAIDLNASAGLVNFNSNSFGTTATTQFGTLVGGASQAITSISPGSAGAVLVSGGAGANPSYVTPTAGTGLTLTSSSSQLTFNQPHGWVLIQTITAASSASILFSSGVTGYTNYMLVGNGITQSVSGILEISLSTNSGSTFLTMNWGNYATAYTSPSFTLVDHTVGTAVPLNSTAILNSSLLCFTAVFTNLTNGNIPSFYFSTIYNANTPTVQYYFGGAYATAGAATCDSIKLLRSTGTFSGTFKLFGLA